MHDARTAHQTAGSLLRVALLMLTSAPGLAGCAAPAPMESTRAEAPAPDPVPVNGIGYVVLNTTITTKTAAVLIGDLDRLHEAGAREIHLGINSAGGSVEAAKSIVDATDRLQQDGVSISVYNLHLVASAATLVFLDAQRRYATPGSTFIFHSASMLGIGNFSASTLRKDADEIDAANALMHETLLKRTHLKASQADVYVSRTVGLSTQDALDDGVIDGVEKMHLDKGTRFWVIGPRPAPKPPTPPPDAS